MRGHTIKKIRSYVDRVYPFLSDERMYNREWEGGPIVLDPRCKRSMSQGIKRLYKKKQRGE